MRVRILSGNPREGSKHTSSGFCLLWDCLLPTSGCVAADFPYPSGPSSFFWDIVGKALGPGCLGRERNNPLPGTGLGTAGRAETGLRLALGWPKALSSTRPWVYARRNARGNERLRLARVSCPHQAHAALFLPSSVAWPRDHGKAGTRTEASFSKVVILGVREVGEECAQGLNIYKASYSQPLVCPWEPEAAAGSMFEVTLGYS